MGAHGALANVQASMARWPWERRASAALFSVAPEVSTSSNRTMGPASGRAFVGWKASRILAGRCASGREACFLVNRVFRSPWVMSDR